MGNLSQQKRQRMLNFLEKLKATNNDEETIIAINEIENELIEKKYGLIWEKHEEEVDIQMRHNVPVFTEIKNKEIIELPDSDNFNFLLEGDNLHSLKLLEKTHKGGIDVIYIDPPYNTERKDFKYDDTYIDINDHFKHSKWCSFMYERLSVARNLLNTYGTIFISIDDDEQAALRFVCDEVFGPENFIANVIWEKKFSPQNDAKWLSDTHDFVIIYAKNKELWKPNLLDRTDGMNARYKNPDNDPRGVWTSGDFSVKTYNASSDYPITTPSGRVVNPPSGSCWRFSKETFENLLKDNRIWFGETGSNVPRVKRFLTEVKQGTVCKTIWNRSEVGDTQEGTRDMKAIFEGQAPFTNPKPIRLINRILDLATNDNSIILDFFAGSGTTGQAVLEYNKIYGGNRKFILCTDNSVSDKEKKKFLKDNNIASTSMCKNKWNKYLEEKGVCSSITYVRLKNTILGYAFKGKKEDILFKKKLQLKDLDNQSIKEINKEINVLIKEKSILYHTVKKVFKDGILSLIGINESKEGVAGIPANLKYYKTDFVPKSSNDEYYSVGEKLMEHIKEMVQLEQGISLDNERYLLILTDEDADELEKNVEKLSKCKKIYISSSVLLTVEQERIFKDKALITIPDYYFENELREVGEL